MSELINEFVEWLITLLSRHSNFNLFLTSYTVVVFYSLGKSLLGFNKPSNYLLSPILRAIGSLLHKLGLYVLLAYFLYFILLIFLSSIASAISSLFTDVSIVDAWKNGIQLFFKHTTDVFEPIYWGGFFGVISSILFSYWLIPTILQEDGLDDVVKISSKFSKLKAFNPIQYFNFEEGCFIGLDVSRRPIYVPWRKLRETHCMVMGMTGSGKGVIMTLIALQSVLKGEGLVWIDPKFDQYSPRLLKEAASHQNKKFVFLNINQDQPPQFNIFHKASASDIEEMLVAGFNLSEQGTDADFYKGKDQDAAIIVSKIAASRNVTSIPELIALCQLNSEITNQENFWRKLRKLGDLKPIQTNSGVCLETELNNGSVIYIVGSTDDERVKTLQKMLLVRVNQLIKKNAAKRSDTFTCIVLDELKHVLSPTTLTSLGVIRSFNAHCLLAMQSLGDLSACPGVSREESEGAVLDNTALKFIYKLGDADFAEKLSKISGKKTVYKANAAKKIDEETPSQGSWIESSIPYVDSDVLTHLPTPSDADDQASVGVLFGLGLAKIFHVGPIEATGEVPLPIPAKPLDDLLHEVDII